MRTGRFFLWIGFAGFVLMLWSGFQFGPGQIENSRNTVFTDTARRVSPAAKKLHKTLRIADLHADSLLWGRDILVNNFRGHVDIPRLIEGNVATQVFSVVSKTPRNLNLQSNDSHSDNITLLAIIQGWPLSTWRSLHERALYQSRRLREFADTSNGRLTLIRTRNDLARYLDDRIRDSAMTAGLLALEGLHVLEGEIGNLNSLYSVGYRMAGLTHFFDNAIGGSAHGLDKQGLTEFGRRVVKRMECLGMLVDLAHASTPLIDDVLAIAERPVLVSHTGVRGTCENVRNLTDQQIRGIAQTGGLIGIGYWPTAVCGTNANAIARAIDYAVDIAGVGHVALGSDFDGSVQTPFDVSELASLTAALIEFDFSETDIRRIMGENLLSLLMRTLPMNDTENCH